MVIAAFILLCAESMKLSPPRNAAFWGTVIVETVGMVVYVIHLFPKSLPVFDMLSFLLFVAAFILLCKSLLINTNYA